MERRNDQRTELTHDIVIDDDLQARDLSEGGIRIESSRPLLEGRKLKVQLDLGFERISVIGTVRWTSASLDDGDDQYVSGLEFQYLNSDDQLLVRQYIEAKAALDEDQDSEKV